MTPDPSTQRPPCGASPTCMNPHSCPFQRLIHEPEPTDEAPPIEPTGSMTPLDPVRAGHPVILEEHGQRLALVIPWSRRDEILGPQALARVLEQMIGAPGTP